MASWYDVVCRNCGEVMGWYKYNPPFDRCDFCNAKLTWRGKWNQDKVRVLDWDPQGTATSSSKNEGPLSFENGEAHTGSGCQTEDSARLRLLKAACSPSAASYGGRTLDLWRREDALAFQTIIKAIERNVRPEHQALL